MAVKLFGFTLGREEEPDKPQIKSFAPPDNQDGSVEMAAGGYYGTYADLEGSAKSETELVTRYREMSLQPECDSAVDDIVNECIIIEENEPAVTINLDNIKFSASIKNKIREEFNNVMNLLDFNNNGYEVFRRWYVDGRLFYHLMIDEKNPRSGLKEVRYIDPRRIRKIREKKRKNAIVNKEQNISNQKYNEYYIYNAKGLNNTAQGLKVSPDSIAYCHSGMVDQRNKMVLSYLHKAIKPLNQLRMLEDATVIYRLARAPERRIFYIDVGNLPKMKAEQYLRDMMTKHKNRLVYDASTGEVRDDRKFMTMLEDYWLPRREGGRGTEITSLPGGTNLGEMEDVDYFRRKLYKSLNVPATRLEAENQFNLGRATEITRDELKFQKLVKRLRTRFSILFDNILEIQLSLKGITSRAEWKEMKNDIYYEFAEDNHFSELKNAEVMRERLSLLNEIDSHVGKYFSSTYVRQFVLRQSEADMKLIDQQIKDEGSDQDDEEMQGMEEPAEQVSTPVANVEPFIPPTEISDEEKKLVESMTKFIDSAVEDENE